MEMSQGSSRIEDLPIEIVVVIASYLSAKDIGACCAASSTMRDVFNDDAIWRPRCNKYLVDYLEKTPPKVQPIFFIPQVGQDSPFNPVPQWRINFMRENHLWNNWRQGKYKKEEIIDSAYPDHRADFHMFQSNDCVIAKFRDGVYLLDVKKFPASNIKGKLYVKHFSSRDTKIETSNNMIIFLVGSCVQVFYLDLITRNCENKYIFCFEDSSQGKNVGFDEKNSEFKGTTRKNIKYVIVGSVLVGTLEGESIMHVWDLETGLKLKEEYSLKNCSVLQIKASDNKHLVLTVGKAIQTTKTYLAYSLLTFEFLPFNEIQHVNSEYCVHRDFVVIVFNKKMSVFNYKTSQMLSSMPTESFPRTIKNKLVFTQNGRINLFNLITNKAEMWPFESVSSFELLGERFVQVIQQGQGFQKNTIWEIDETCKNFKKTSMYFHFNTCGFFLNKACTRYVVREAVGNLLNFW